MTQKDYVRVLEGMRMMALGHMPCARFEPGMTSERTTTLSRSELLISMTCYTPFIQIQQTRKGLPDADINDTVLNSG